ncbi:hypothetical protein ACOQFV_09090 [Nocardiopsis changdeensis]|uniref:Phage tail protein n=1 Tax=Nocardiopsis changdeensis TaxID=2831969 RepID=A0ABX8BIS2_9ACTN|nr:MULTISPECIES: hypothetical protein [Nocardiopsis]QUX20303.1 hypothetical protein KGD84_17390 [Nocardiopsis changdeensis]QYX36233.1 hypothetical protein K1J57_26845 [Nocardiopsis sp. MT53]
MADLAERQYEVGGVVFGDLTPIQSDDIRIGDTEVRTDDRDSPGVDGSQMGRDYRDGRTIGLDLWSNVHTAGEIRGAWAALKAAWSADTARLTPREVVPFRFRLEGSTTVVVYGRPRRWAPASQRQRGTGLTEVVADFRTVDRLFYSDVEKQVALTLVADGGGGITWPVTWPITWAPGGERQDAVVNGGDEPTWPVITIRGPVAQPEIELVGTGRSLRLDMTVAFDRAVTIDTRPWARTIRDDNGVSYRHTAKGAALADFQLPVGQTVLAYRGTDMSGQSSCTVSWRDATENP